MRNYITFSFLTLLIFAACNSDDCTKTIVVQPETTVQTPGGSVYYPEVTQEIPCGSPEPELMEISEPDPLENFSYEVISFYYTPETGNGTTKLQFEIKLNNGNNFEVSGVPVLTFSLDGDFEFSGSYSSDASSPCYEIGANASCNLIYDKEFPNETGASSSMELINVEYFTRNQ